MPLHRKIGIGLVLGLLLGAGVNVLDHSSSPLWEMTALPVLDFVGRAFLRAITMMVIPLVVASLFVGVTSLGDLRRLGRMGAKTLGVYLSTTALAISIGLALAGALRPGSGLSASSRDALARKMESQAASTLAAAESAPSLAQVVLDLIPANPLSAAVHGQLLPLIVFVLLFGAALAQVPADSRRAFVGFFEAVNAASMRVIGWIMKLAPLAVFSLVAAVVSRFGFEVLKSLALYALVVVLSLAVHVLGVYSALVAFLVRMRPWDFFRRIREVLLIAFSTSSSNATLPVTMQVAERKLGVSKSVSAFVLPLGATLNMDGTALYQGVATVFIAQVHGVELGAAALLTIVLTATLSSIGTAGIPSAGIVTLILVLESVGLAAMAPVGIALILGVDRVLDMLRTCVNVTGDLTCAAVVARSENALAAGEAPRAGPGSAQVD